MQFSQKSVDFLFENRLHDSREWFNAHKEDYRTYVTEPMKELILELAPTILKIDPLIEINPNRISRLYRDMRLHPDSIFRDHIWYTFSRSREQYHALPGFYFSIGAFRDKLRLRILLRVSGFHAGAAQPYSRRRRRIQGGIPGSGEAEDIHALRRYVQAQQVSRPAGGTPSMAGQEEYRAFLRHQRPGGDVLRQAG